MLPLPSPSPDINRLSRSWPKRHRRGGCPTCSGADQLTSITDAKNQKTTWVYDTLNRDGLFISKDPIGFAGGDVNLYGYVDSAVFQRSVKANHIKLHDVCFSELYEHQQGVG